VFRLLPRTALFAALIPAGCTWDWDRFASPAAPADADDGRPADAGRDAGASPVPLGVPGMFELAFQEECEGDRVDPAKWNTKYYRGGTFQYYSWSGSAAVDGNVLLEDGLCKLRLDNRPFQDKKPFSTGVLDSGGKFQQTHGYFEARLKAARGQGFRTVFLLSHPTAWPPQVDVARIPGHTPTRANHIVWFEDDRGADLREDSPPAPESPDFSEDFHVFGVLWGPDTLEFYLDGKRTWQATRANAARVRGPLKFEITAHIGGDNNEAPDATNVWPSYVLIDYVRAWRAR
jgi:beta-glucanase (GH16 family)